MKWLFLDKELQASEDCNPRQKGKKVCPKQLRQGTYWPMPEPVG